jgi:arylsulfatase A-like enzyme
VSLTLVAGALAWMLVREQPATDAAAARHPNVLLVSIDSLRADHLGSYGYPRDTTPSIDRLARRGALFETAISSASWTVPAHMTMLTGLPPEVHGVNDRFSALSPDAVTLAEALHGAGYQTAAFISGPTVMAQYGFAQGFDLFDDRMVEVGRTQPTSPGLLELVEGHLDRWSDAGRHAPFFVFLHMWDVHYDYAPPEPYDRLFDPDYAGDLTGHDFEQNARIHAGMDARDLQHLIALYDGEIRYTDEHVGRVIERLRALHALDDTIVVVTSDHGEEFFEHGLKGHAKTLYDEVLHVPLVISYPRGVRFAQRIHAQVRTMDLAPTILGLAGVAAPAGFGAAGLAAPYRSVDLSPWLGGIHARLPMPEPPAFSDIRGLLGHQRSIRTLGAKMIHFDVARRNHLANEVFDLRQDPREQRNLLGTGEEPELADQLDHALAAWGTSVDAQTKLAVAQHPSAQQEARLRSLGYVQ